MPDIDDAPPPGMEIVTVAELLTQRLTEYLAAYPPAYPTAEDMRALSLQRLRSYVYSGAIYVLAHPFHAWFMEQYGITEELAYFSEAIRFMGGMNGEVRSSTEGGAIQIWRLPTHGLYTMSDAFMQRRILH